MGLEDNLLKSVASCTGTELLGDLSPSVAQQIGEVSVRRQYGPKSTVPRD